MNEIEQARDVLAKWRKESAESKQPWSIGDRAPESWARDLVVVACDNGQGDVTDYLAPADAALIVGTAGNPDLLDAIDSLLAEAAADIDSFGDNFGLWDDVSGIAAAIIAADERMQQ